MRSSRSVYTTIACSGSGPPPGGVVDHHVIREEPREPVGAFTSYYCA